MRVTLARDGKKEEVEVGPDLDYVVLGGSRFPVTVVSSTAMRVELEIAGEKVVVENWPDHFATPPGPVDVNGERWKIGIERGTSDPAKPRTARASAAGPTTPATTPFPETGSGVPVMPSMPGRVVELRVKEGDRVRKGDVLLVLEAMKMRNELTSPADGVVRDIRVASGANARPNEPMLFVAAA
jgi:glutaconyl-CoA/methylmalonyl-CoA decarboxylase subunit gamma